MKPFTYTKEDVEVAAEAAWAGYMGYLPRAAEPEFYGEYWEGSEESRAEWPMTSIYPNADQFRQAVTDGLNAIRGTLV